MRGDKNHNGVSSLKTVGDNSSSDMKLLLSKYQRRPLLIVDELDE